MVNEPKRNILEGIENTGDVHLHDHRLRLKQRFDIIRKLGQGTYGKVQLGINKKTGQEVAIKTIKKCKIETEADLVRLRREVQIMSSVRHPNIIHIYEVFENSEKMILVMEYCSGGELYDYLSQRKVLQEDEARRLFRQIATAVYYCHKHKICHRDLKLENVLLDEHGSAKIADFGLSNVFEEKRLLSTFCGSPLYASPEIVKGTPYIGPEVDCWSLGVLLYTLVYGAMPFDGSNFKRLVKQISTGDYFEPKNPSTASPLIRDMLTVDPIQRADITHICDHPWVNKGSDVPCLELAEALANETPVRLDLLLSLAPPPVSDKLVVTDEATTAGPDGSPGRSMSVAAIDASAERRILEMVAEGGTDAIKPSPTRTIMSADQPKRKLETTVSMDSAPSQRKKERFLRSSSKVDNMGSPQNETVITPVENNVHPQELQKDVSMVEQNNLPKESSPKAPSPVVSNQKIIKTPTKEIVKPAPVPVEPQPENVLPNNHVDSQSPTKTTTTAVNSQTKKEPKPETKPRDSVLKEKNTVVKPSVGVKKKISSLTAKSDDKKVAKTKEKSPPRKSIEKDGAKKVAAEENNKTNDAQAIKQPTERRRSRILDAAEKLNNLSIQPAPVAPPPVASPPPAKPKKVLIPGVSVGSFKEQFERRASLTSGAPVVEKKAVKSPPGQSTPNKTLADKKMHSVDSEHPAVTPQLKPVEKEQTVKLQNIGIEPPQQAEIISVPEPESPKKPPVPVSEPSTPLVNNNSRISKPLHKSESLRESSNRKENLSNSISLEDARKSLQHSIALLSQAKNDPQSLPKNVEDNHVEAERQTKLKAAREIISNAIGDDNNTGKKVQRICMGGKPPVPYGAGGRSASGSLNLSSLGGSPPMSPPHQTVTSPSATPPRTYRTEVQHRMEDVRNKFLPTARGGSIERIIPIHFTSEIPNKQQPTQKQTSPPQSTQLPYQRNNTMPYRLSSVPRSTSVQHEPERESSQPPTPFTPLESPRVEPIKKSPREFIIPIAVEGVGYVTPRQGSLEPSDTPTKLPSANMPFGSRFPKPRRLSSLVSGGESEDEDDMHMHRLRSSRRVRNDPEKDSVSSGEEDEDEEGFELLTAENLFSTLLDRVRNLTNRLNGEEGTGFPQRHQSLFNNLHSPFFNSPHLPRKHNKHSVMRDGPSWRRSTSRDIASDFDSMFPSHTTFPRGSRRSSRKGSKHNGDQQQSSHTPEQHNGDTTASQQQHDTQYPNDHLDLSDLDLSKIQLTEKEVETLSGLTPGLSRRLQRQLLSHLPPAAARSLRRTLSAHLPPQQHPHVYSRSLSASKTDPLSCNSPVGGDNECELQHREHNIAEDEEESSISYNSAKSYADNNNKEYKEPSDKYSDVSDIHSSNNDRSYRSLYTAERSKSPSVSDSLTPHVSSNCKQTPERSVLEKYLSPERIAFEKYPLSNNDYEYSSILSEPAYTSTYGSGSSIPIGGSLRRRSLRTPPIENGHRRISRFLRPDFFDTPREESIYVKEKRDKELETQKVLKEIRQKKLRPGSGDSYVASPTSPLTSSDVSHLFESSNVRNSVSPISSSIGRDKSRSITPFYPSLDNISEHNADPYTNSSLRSALVDINKHCTNSTMNASPVQQNIHTPQQYNKESFIARPKSYPSKPTDNIIQIQSIELDNVKPDAEENANTPKVMPTIMESKLLRPKSYPSTSPSPEKFVGVLPKPKVVRNSNLSVEPNNSVVDAPIDQNISVSFNVSIPAKTPNRVKEVKDDSNTNVDVKSQPVVNNMQNGEITVNQVETMPKIPNGTENIVSNNKGDTNIKTSPPKEIIKTNAVLLKKPSNGQVKNAGTIEEKKSESPPKTESKSTDSSSIEAQSKVEEKNEKSDPCQISPSKDVDKNSSEEKKKRTVIKKKIIVKKKGTVKKTDATKSTEKPVEGEEQIPTVAKDTKTDDEKVSPIKKKSVLHSIGERFEKFRSDSFNKAASQEKEIVKDAKEKERATPVKEEKSSRIENVIRALRERSVPNNNQEEQVTESGLIKRAVTITDLPTLDAKTSSSKKTVNKVLGLFKKAETKDNNKSDAKNNNFIDNNGIDNANQTPSASHSLVLDKPRRPTSLLLNGIGRRVQACYNGTTSDSVLVNDDNPQSAREKTPLGQTKSDEGKSQKKGLRLDFSKLPRLNQSIFNKRNSQDMSKSRESSVSKEMDDKTENIINNNEVSNNNGDTPVSQSLDNNANGSNTLSCPNWSPDYDCSNFMVDSPMEHDHTENHLPHRNHEATSPDPENIEDRIRRKSFYLRFNEKKNKRKSLLVGPGAKEYNPSERIHSHPDNENNSIYYNRYDFSPTSSSKSDKTSEFSKYSDKNESPKYKNNNEPLSPYSYKSLDRNDRKYLLDPPYQPYVEKTSQYSIPRYSRTVSMHDNNYDSKLPSTTVTTTDPRKNSMRYGRSFSLLSPGNYNTYNPRTHSRNSAILLRDDTETEPYTTESILTKIRNRKKLTAVSPSTDDEDYLDSKYRSNIHSTSNNEHDVSDDKIES